MDKRKEELQRISKDLRQFLAQHCKADGGKYNDFVGESCDTAYQMLQNTLCRLGESDPPKS
ncbi:MAG: hypothetical protein FJX42_01465 [Alphaproteobacteria bacterium]|nr:hypothetical protein [Alphaproteobacteria bacterium]